MGKEWDGFYEKPKDEREHLVKRLNDRIISRLHHLDESQNFADDVFTSLVNQVSDVVFATTVMRQIPQTHHLFVASMVCLGANAVVRLGIGLAAACAVQVQSFGRLVLGLLWVMIEPVSGGAIIQSSLIPGTLVDDDVDWDWEDLLGFELMITKVKSRMRLDFSMGLLEDIPELAIDVAFVVVVFTKDVDDEDTMDGADISLFVLSAILSIYHVVKCFWTFFKIRSAITESDHSTPDDVSSWEEEEPHKRSC
jgi:hypothetical protein